MGQMTLADREDALEKLMASYGDSILRVCYLFLHDRQLAEDAAQDTFVKAWRAMDRLRHGETEKAWLARIAVNTCRSLLRRRAFRMAVGSVPMDNLSEAGTWDTYPDDTVFRAVEALPVKLRSVVILYYFQGFSTDETARILGIPGATVRSRLGRARSKLRKRLEGWYFDDE